MSIVAVHIAKMAGTYQNPAACMPISKPVSQNEATYPGRACSPKPPHHKQMAGTSPNPETTALIHRKIAATAVR